jgi:hypothetical protein
MFYTLSSRSSLITGDSSSRKYFRIFLVGTVMYILLHYYLHTKELGFITEKLQHYLYYIMASDYLIACAWVRFGSSDTVKEDISERNDVLTKVDDLKQLQLLKEQMVKKQECPFVKTEKNENKEKEEEKPVEKPTKKVASSSSSSSEKKSSKKKSSSSSSSPVAKKPKKSKSTSVSDTDIQIYIEKN